MPDGERLIIEIYHKHAVDKDKTEKLKAGKLSCIEIDVSNQDDDYDSLRRFLLEDDTDRKWINAPLLEEENRQILATQGSILSFIKEYQDLSDSFNRNTILKLLKKWFSYSKSFCFITKRHKTCKFAKECNLRKSTCERSEEYQIIDFTQKYGIPEIKLFESEELLRVSYKEKASPKDYIIFIGFKPCNVEKLRDRVYVTINHNGQIDELVNTGCCITSTNVCIGESLKFKEIKVQPYCQHPMFCIFGSGVVISQIDNNSNNGFINKSKAGLIITKDSLSILHSAIRYDDANEYSLYKLGLYLSQKNGIENRNCLLCKFRRKNNWENPSKCTKYNISLSGKMHLIAWGCDDYEINPVIPQIIENVINQLEYYWWNNPSIQHNIDKSFWKKKFNHLRGIYKLSDIPTVTATENQGSRNTIHDDSEYPIFGDIMDDTDYSYSDQQIKKEPISLNYPASLFILFNNGTFLIKKYQVINNKLILEKNAVLHLLFPYDMEDVNIVLAHSLDFCFKNEIPLVKCSYCNHIKEKFCDRIKDKCNCDRFSLNGDLTKVKIQTKDVLFYEYR